MLQRAAAACDRSMEYARERLSTNELSVPSFSPPLTLSWRYMYCLTCVSKHPSWQLLSQGSQMSNDTVVRVQYQRLFVMRPPLSHLWHGVMYDGHTDLIIVLLPVPSSGRNNAWPQLDITLSHNLNCLKQRRIATCWTHKRPGVWKAELCPCFMITRWVLKVYAPYSDRSVWPSNTFNGIFCIAKDCQRHLEHSIWQKVFISPAFV